MCLTTISACHMGFGDRAAGHIDMQYHEKSPVSKLLAGDFQLVTLLVCAGVISLTPN